MKYFYKDHEGNISVYRLVHKTRDTVYLENVEGGYIKGPVSIFERDFKRVNSDSVIDDREKRHTQKDENPLLMSSKYNVKVPDKWDSSITTEESAKNAQKHINSRANKMDKSIHSKGTPNHRYSKWCTSGEIILDDDK